MDDYISDLGSVLSKRVDVYLLPKMKAVRPSAVVLCCPSKNTSTQNVLTFILCCCPRVCCTQPGCRRTPVAPVAACLGKNRFDSHPDLAEPLHFPTGYDQLLFLCEQSVGLLQQQKNNRMDFCNISSVCVCHQPQLHSVFCAI